MSMMGGVRFALPAALIASLAFAAPAFGQVQAQQTVGQPNVITDPASQVNGTTTPAPALPPAPPAQPQTSGGNQQAQLSPQNTTPPPLHVTQQLIGHRPSLSNATRAVSTSTPAAATQAVASTPSPHTATASAGSSRPQLPFTGIDAWQIALVGVALLGSGLALRRLLAVLFQPVQ